MDGSGDKTVTLIRAADRPFTLNREGRVVDGPREVNRIRQLCLAWLFIGCIVLILAGGPAAAQENLDVLVTADPPVIAPGGTVALLVTVTYNREPVHDAVVQVTTEDEGIAISMDLVI